jgi:hypothetical protein
MRGHLNAVLAYMRLGEDELMEEAIKGLRRDLTALETEARLVVKGE